MTQNSELFSYVAQNCRDAVERVMQRKNNFKYSHDPLEPLMFEGESLIGLNLAYAPLYLRTTEEEPTPEHGDYYEDEYGDYADETPEAPAVFDEEDWAEHFETQCDVSFKWARLSFANFTETKARLTNFAAALLSFARFDGADLRDCNFEGADLTGTVFDGADLENASFTIDAGILLASFKNVKNFDTARFYVVVDDERRPVSGVVLDDQGRIAKVAATKDKSAKQAFSGSADEAVPFAILQQALTKQIETLKTLEIVEKISAAQQNETGNDPASLATLLDQYINAKQQVAATPAPDKKSQKSQPRPSS